MLRFPFPGTALFEGAYFAPEDLPNYYLPKLIGIQITEPALICFALGVGALIYLVFKNQRAYFELSFISFFWLFAPVIWAVVGDSNLYDDFRQLHFILPPLFLIAGLGLRPLFQKLNAPYLKVLILVLLIIPGITGYLRLFPYEYTYYNSFAGKPTFRQYESDYWATSFREASRFLNEAAPLNSKVVVWGPVSTISSYLRPDIEATGYDQGLLPDGPYYALIISRFENDLIIHPDIPVLFAIEKDGAILSVIKYIE